MSGGDIELSTITGAKGSVLNKKNKISRKNNTENTRKREILHRVLETLSREYPNSLDSLRLIRQLACFGHPVGLKDITFFLSYLEDCGYVATEKRLIDITSWQRENELIGKNFAIKEIPPDISLAKLTIRGWEKLGLIL